MHEEEEQTQFVVVGQIQFFGIFQSFFILEKENNTEKITHTLLHIGNLARLPLGQICIEDQCSIKRCRECVTTFKKNENTPHTKNTTRPKKKQQEV